MKKVILFGDSIRLIGYGTVLPQILGADYEVWQPKDNGRFSLYTLCNLKSWLNDANRKPDVIHWNNGLWDAVVRYEEDGPLVPKDLYVQMMLRIARELKKAAPRVIFATTTPVRPEKTDQDNNRICAYNEAIVPKLQNMGIEINDLHSLVAKDIPRYIRSDDNIHLTDEGILLCANRIAEILR